MRKQIFIFNRSYTVLKEITDLKWEKHITQLWASSWTGRKFSDQPCLHLVNLALQHSPNMNHNCHLNLFRIPTVFAALYIYIYINKYAGPLSSCFLFDLLVQRFSSSLCAVHSFYTTHVRCISKTLDLAGSLQSTFPEYWTKKWWEKTGKFKDFLGSISFTIDSPQERVTHKFQIQPFCM